MSQRIELNENMAVVPVAEAAPARAKRLNRGDVFADEIGASLRDPFRSEYIIGINRDTRRGLNEGLRGVGRWIDLGGENMNPAFKENNLDHTVGLLNWCNEVEDKYPALKREVSSGSEKNWRELLTMIMMHDIGEIATGDLCRCHPNFTQKVGKIHKRKEALAALSMISNHAPPKMAGELKSLYKRFDHRHPEDKLVNFGHTLDKCQADATVAREIIPYNIGSVGGFNSPDRTYDRQCNGLNFAEKVADRTDNKMARVELAQFVTEKVVADYDKLKTPDIEWIQKLVRDRIRQNIIK